MPYGAKRHALHASAWQEMQYHNTTQLQCDASAEIGGDTACLTCSLRDYILGVSRNLLWVSAYK